MLEWDCIGARVEGGWVGACVVDDVVVEVDDKSDLYRVQIRDTPT